MLWADVGVKHVFSRTREDPCGSNLPPKNLKKMVFDPELNGEQDMEKISETIGD